MDLILFLIFGAVGLASYKFFGKRGGHPNALEFSADVPAETIGAFLQHLDRIRPVTHVEQLRVVLRAHGLQLDRDGVIERIPPVARASSSDEMGN